MLSIQKYLEESVPPTTLVDEPVKEQLKKKIMAQKPPQKSWFQRNVKDKAASALDAGRDLVKIAAPTVGALAPAFARNNPKLYTKMVIGSTLGRMI